jgi:hypothetical protein
MTALDELAMSYAAQIGYAAGTLSAWYFEGLIPDKPMLRLIEGLEREGFNVKNSVLADVRRFIHNRDEYRHVRIRVASIHDNGA